MRTIAEFEDSQTNSSLSRPTRRAKFFWVEKKVEIWQVNKACFVMRMNCWGKEMCGCPIAGASAHG